jgi:HPt (histidine-containing phosphotransfer) domain-containing protein
MPEGNWLMRVIDRFVPEHILRATEDRKRQLRTAIGFLMASALMAAVFSFANFKQQNLAAAWCEACAVFVLAFCIVAIRRTGRYVVFGNLGMSTGMASLILACWYAGGLGGPALIMLPLAPAYAYLGYGRATALLWSALSVLVVFGLFIATHLGILPPPRVSESHLLTNRLVDALLGIGFGYLAAQIFNGIKDYALNMLQQRTAQLATVNASMGELFDNMRQGVLAFDGKGKIDVLASAQAPSIFGVESVGGENVVDLLFAGGVDLVGNRNAFEQFVELAFSTGVSDWDALVSCVPTHIERQRPEGTQHLMIELRPILDHKKRVHRVMMLVTDETERVRMAAEAKERDEKHQREVHELRRLVAGGAHLVLRFLEQSARRLDETVDALCVGDERIPRREDVAVAFQHVHTVRGEARTFQLGELERTCMELEELLAPLRSARASEAGERELKEQFDILLTQAKRALDDARSTLVSLSPIGSAVLDQITVRRSQLDELCALVERDAQTLGEIAQATRELSARPFGESTQQLAAVVPLWAKQESKRVRLDIEGREVSVPHGLSQILSAVLTHLVRNAIAHGVEPPLERERMGKPPEATLRLCCQSSENGGACIVVTDDGMGVDEAKVRAQAARLGLDENAPLLELLFSPGLSTSARSSEISGRGMGMSAVKRELEAVGYGARLTSEPGKGTRIEIYPDPSPEAVKRALGQTRPSSEVA